MGAAARVGGGALVSRGRSNDGLGGPCRVVTLGQSTEGLLGSPADVHVAQTMVEAGRAAPELSSSGLLAEVQPPRTAQEARKQPRPAERRRPS
jgi:hypothetical protein